MIRHVEAVKPAVKGFFAAGDGNLELGAVVIFTRAGVGRLGFLSFNGQADCLGFALDQLLKQRLDVLVGGGFRFMFGEPSHLVGDLFAAIAEVLSSCQLLGGIAALDVDFPAFGGSEIENEDIEDRESSDGEEDQEFFFTGGHEAQKELRNEDLLMIECRKCPVLSVNDQIKVEWSEFRRCS